MPREAMLWDVGVNAIDRRFADFDRRFPEVYTLFIRFARELKARGHEQGSAEQIIQRIRWETAVNPDHGSGDYKINDHYRSRYARKLATEFPDEFGSFFHFRKRA